MPRNDGKSLTLLNAANNELRVDSSLREKPGKKVLYFTKCLKGFSWQSSKAHTPAMTKEDGQGDCFVPRNDGKSPTVTHPSNEGKSVDSSLRENPWNEKLII